ncbi:hypothetical protein J437_LFUL014571 [Ladona fulva]|uniref:Uncharacterized protein n=1 Tax=Ladona fulva TaxID=123851 RepID=A0A8K0KGM6_LADFU|nr:hypothetical protein J437_LFUL014571 [Ladona fulva]
MERRKFGMSSITVVIFILCATTETGAFFFFLPEAYYPYFYPHPHPPTTTTTTTTTPAPTTKKYHPHGGYEYHLPPGDSYHNSGPWDHGGSVWLEDYPGYQHTTPPPPTTTKPPTTTTPAPTKPPMSYGHNPEEYPPYESHGPPSSHYGGYFHHSNPWEGEIWEEEYEGYPPVTKPPPTTSKPTTTPPPPTTPAPTKPSYNYVYPRIRYNPYHSHKGYGPPSYYTPPPPTTTPPPPPTTPPPTIEYPYPPVDDYPPPPSPPKYRKYPQKRPPPNYNHYNPYSRRPKGPPDHPPSDYESYGDDSAVHQSPKPTRIPVPPPPWLAKDKAPKMPDDDYESDTAPPGYPSSKADEYEDHGYETDKPPPVAPPTPQRKRKYPSSYGNSYRGKPIYSHTPHATTPAPVTTPYNRPPWQRKSKQSSPSYSLTTPSSPIQTTPSPYLLPPRQSFDPPPYSHYQYQPVAAIPVFSYNQNGSQVLIPSYPLQLSYNYTLSTSAPPPASTPAPQATNTPQPVNQHNSYPILTNYASYLPAPTNAPIASSTPKVRYVLPQSYGTPEAVASSLRNLTSGKYIPRPMQPLYMENPPPALPQSSYALPYQYAAPSLAKHPSPVLPIQYQFQFYSLPQPTPNNLKPSAPPSLLLPNSNYLPPQQFPLPSNPYQNVLSHPPEYLPPQPSSSPPSTESPSPTPPSSLYLPPQLYSPSPTTPKSPPLQYQNILSQLGSHQDYLPTSTYTSPQTTKRIPLSSQYLPPQQYDSQTTTTTTQKPSVPTPPPSQYRYLSAQPNLPTSQYIPPYDYLPTSTQKSPLPPPLHSNQYIPPITTSTPNPYSPFSCPPNQLHSPTSPLIYLPPPAKGPPPPQHFDKYLPSPRPASPLTPSSKNQYYTRPNAAQRYIPPNPYRSPATTKKSASTTPSNQYLPPQLEYTTAPAPSTTSGPTSTLLPQNQYLSPLVTKKPLIPSPNNYLPPYSYNSLVKPIPSEEPQTVAPPGDKYIPYLVNPLQSSLVSSAQLPNSSNVTSTYTSSQASSPESLGPVEVLASSNQSSSVQPTDVDADHSVPSIEPISRYLLPPYEEIIPSGAQKNISDTSGSEEVNLNIQRSSEYELLYQQSENFRNVSQVPFQSYSPFFPDASSHDSIGAMEIENLSLHDSAKSPTVKRSTHQHGIIEKGEDLVVYESHQQTSNSAKSTFDTPQEDPNDHFNSRRPPSKIPPRPIPPLVTYGNEGHIPPYPIRVNAEDKVPYEEEKIRNLKDSLSYPGIEKSGVRALSDHAIHYLASAAQALSVTARPIQE